ncbi:DUF3530 family protein [Rheinheimera baltica]|uniref:DUF3530 family protein n=1 Tax=Rheinheimera baltica TaxID=67576 RepID=UPI0003F74604|nr:DUF3530 family protein [Rheinheimera baltica]
MSNSIVYSLVIAVFVYITTGNAYAASTTEQNYTADLLRQLPSDEILELSASQQIFISLQRERMTSYTKGTIIFLPDASEHAASPKHIDMLRQQLTYYGWYTLALMPPALPLTLEQDTLTDYQQIIAERMSAAQQQAQQHSGATIVIAQGSSAAILNQLFATARLTEPAAFIMLGAFLPDQKLNHDMAKALATHHVPTLDISHEQDNSWVTSQLPLRRQLANKHMKAVYRQRLINGSGYNDTSQQWVLQEIYGWLSSVGL